jgi:2-hydroxy-3-keto-5-methylthiopentenyl-1-phosphate phosphatase
MYHKTAQQLAEEFIVIPDPRLDEAARAAKLVVEEFGPVEIIDNHVKAHIALGRLLEEVDENDVQGIAACLGVMAFIEEVLANAILGEDRITIIKIK